MEVIGQVLLVGPDVVTSYLTDWLPRGGNRLLAALEVVAWDDNAPPLCTLRVQTKDLKDPDGATAEIAVLDVTSIGIGSVVSSGCLELVRYQVQVKGDEGQWAHVNALPPSWLPN